MSHPSEHYSRREVHNFDADVFFKLALGELAYVDRSRFVSSSLTRGGAVYPGTEAKNPHYEHSFETDTGLWLMKELMHLYYRNLPAEQSTESQAAEYAIPSFMDLIEQGMTDSKGLRIHYAVATGMFSKTLYHCIEHPELIPAYEAFYEVGGTEAVTATTEAVNSYTEVLATCTTGESPFRLKILLAWVKNIQYSETETGNRVRRINSALPEAVRNFLEQTNEDFILTQLDHDLWSDITSRQERAKETIKYFLQIKKIMALLPENFTRMHTLPSSFYVKCLGSESAKLALNTVQSIVFKLLDEDDVRVFSPNPEYLTGMLNGSPLYYGFVQLMKKMRTFASEQWNSGRKLSDLKDELYVLMKSEIEAMDESEFPVRLSDSLRLIQVTTQ